MTKEETALRAKLCMRRWRAKNLERSRKQLRQYYLKHKSKIDTRRRELNIINKDKITRQNKVHGLKRYYNMTIEQFEQMKISQDNRCAACGSIFENSFDTHVDHNHETKKVRQLLCAHCNLALGMLGENYDRIINLANYIRKWEAVK